MVAQKAVTKILFLSGHGLRNQNKMAMSTKITLLFILVVFTNAQDPFEGNNPLIQGGPFSMNVQLTYRAAREVTGPVCNRDISLEASTVTVDVGTSPEVSASEVRVPPQVTILGPTDPGAYYTLVLAGQPEYATDFATSTMPIAHWVQADIQSPSTGVLNVAPFLPLMPFVARRGIALVMLYRQPGPSPPTLSISSYVDNECKLGAGRCKFDVVKFAIENSFTLDFAGYFTVKTDRYSTALSALSPFVENACFYLDKFDLQENVLVGEKAMEFKLGVMAKFISPGSLVGPVCGRVFHYKEEEVQITAGTGEPVPARKTRTIPWVWYHTMDDDESWKDDWFTLAYVSQLTDWPAGGTPEKPLLLWLVTNIKGGDVSNGMCDVPYHPAMPTSGTQEELFILYKQEEIVEISAADYSEGDCELQYRCKFNLDKMANDNKLSMVGAQNFELAADPYTVVSQFKSEKIDETEACRLLKPFTAEGKMLGQCLPKFTSWKELKERIEKTDNDAEKNKIMEQMMEMCPEMAEEMSKGGDDINEIKDEDKKNEEKKDEMEKMKEWLMHEMAKQAWEKKEQEEKDTNDMESNKYFLSMLMKNMFGEDSGGMVDKKGNDNDSAEKRGDNKDCEIEMIDMIMKMKKGEDMTSGNWDDKEKELSPCMRALAEHLKKLHREYVNKKHSEDVREKFEEFMKTQMSEFVKHMMIKKKTDDLGYGCIGKHCCGRRVYNPRWFKCCGRKLGERKLIRKWQCCRGDCEIVVWTQWGPWSSWSLCTKSCGSGQRTRVRTCIRNQGTGCPGQNEEEQTCNEEICPEPSFSSGVSQGIVTALEEGSGLAASRKHPGILYTHNDKGGQNRIFAIDANTAQLRATLTISGATNLDWEDVCVGTCGSDTCLYIGDTGSGGEPTKTVYRVKEPATISDQSLPVDSKLLFRWNQKDCETLMIDTNEELYIASKTDDEPSFFAHVPSAGNWGTGNVITVQATVQFTLYSTKKNPVGGDISPNGQEMLIKFKEYVLYYKLNSGETYEQAITRDPVKLPYTTEPRGESICWSSNADGYYTMSENEGEPRPLLITNDNNPNKVGICYLAVLGAITLLRMRSHLEIKLSVRLD